MDRRLYKTKDGAMLAGVCAGIAEYFVIDVTLVRIGFVLIALAGGSGLLAYILAAIIMPEKGQVVGGAGRRDEPIPQAQQAPETTAEESFTSPDKTDSGWKPVGQENASRPHHGDNQRVLAYILIGIGAWILMERYVNFNIVFRHWWPLLLVGIGVLMLTGNWNRRA